MIKCIFKGLVGLHMLSSSLQNSHDTRHVEIFFVQGLSSYEAF